MDFTIERAAERRMKMTQKGLLNRQTNGEEECGDYENEKKIFWGYEESEVNWSRR